MLYYEAGLIIFAVIGWAQLRVGKVVQSRKELLLIFLDLALITFIIVAPNPFGDEVSPTAFQDVLGSLDTFTSCSQPRRWLIHGRR
jgi:adenylate cyclase